MTATRRVRSGERGFAIAETLIAAAIIAAMMGLLYQAIDTSARAAHRQRDQRRAIMVAQSVLARVGGDIALAPGVIDGASDGMAWRVTMTPHDREGAAALSAAAVVDIDVTVREGSDSDRQLFALSSARLAP